MKCPDCGYRLHGKIELCVDGNAEVLCGACGYSRPMTAADGRKITGTSRSPPGRHLEKLLHGPPPPLPEPWQEVRMPEGQLVSVMANDGRLVNGPVLFRTSQDEQNWRRIIACVNFLYKIPTETIETGDWAAVLQASYEFRLRFIPEWVSRAIRLLRRKDAS